MQTTTEIVQGWLDTFSPVETLAENPPALAKEFGTIVAVFTRENAPWHVIDDTFERIKATSQSRAWPTVAQVYEALRYARRDKDSEAQAGVAFGDRNALDSYKLKDLSVIIDTAKRWLRTSPGLRGHAMTTLQYWKEPIVDDRGKNWTPAPAK